MIHSARPIVTPVANIVFCCFVFLDLKNGDGRTTCAKTIPTGRDFGLAEWINNKVRFKDTCGLALSNLIVAESNLYQPLNFKVL